MHGANVLQLVVTELKFVTEPARTKQNHGSVEVNRDRRGGAPMSPAHVSIKRKTRKVKTQSNFVWLPTLSVFMRVYGFEILLSVLYSKLYLLFKVYSVLDVGLCSPLLACIVMQVGLIRRMGCLGYMG